MKLRFLTGRDQGRIVDIKATGLTIGRDASCSLQVEEEGISREHCRVYQHNGKWLVEDLKSTNGVRLNGQRLIAPAELRSGDRIGISQQLFLFADDDDIIDVAAAVTSPEPPPARDATADATEPPAKAKPAVSSVPPRKTSPVEEENLIVIPWFRLALTVGIMILLTWVLVKSITGSGTDKAGQQEETPAQVTAEPGIAGVSESAPSAFPEETDSVSPDILAAMDELTDDDLPIASAPAGTPSATTEPPRPSSPAVSPVATSPQAQATESSSAILINTSPAGARILINNQLRGLSPMVITDLPQGRHSVIMRKDGYEDLVRQIYVPSLIPKDPYILRQRPGTAMITSNPPGATVLHGTQVLGQTPQLITSFGAGQYELRINSMGYEPQRATVTVSGISGTSLHVDLVSILGEIQIVTAPSGCEVRVDGVVKGITVPGGEDGKSKPFLVPGLPEGERMIEVEHSLGAVRRGKVKLKRGEVRTINLMLWVIDTRLTLKDGTVKIGMLVEQNEHNDIVLAESPKRYERYLSPQIARTEKLSVAEARELMGKSTEARHAAEVETLGAQPGTAESAATAPAQMTTISVQDLEKEFERYPEADLNRMYQNKQMTISGPPVSFEKDAFSGRFDLSRSVRCFMDIRQFEAVEARIQDAIQRRLPLTVSGTVAGYHGGALIMRNCRLE